MPAASGCVSCTRTIFGSPVGWPPSGGRWRNRIPPCCWPRLNSSPPPDGRSESALPSGAGPAGNPPAHVAGRLLVQNFVPLPTAVFRRTDALHVHGLDPALWYTADWDFWLKLAARGPTRYLPQPTAAFRLHPDSQTVKRSGGIDGFRGQHDMVRERHWPIWRDRLVNAKRVMAAANLSVEMNVLIAGLLHRSGADWKRLLAAIAAAGLGDATHFVNSSRILERVSARIRAGLVRDASQKHKDKNASAKRR